MAELKLKGFASASQTDAQTASNESTLARSQSPFQHGVTFKITGYDFVKPVYNDTKASAEASFIPVLTTTIGNLFIKMLLRKGVDKDGNIVNHDGAFNQKIAEILSANTDKNDGEILQLILKDYKNQKLAVSRKDFVAVGKDGRSYPTSLVDINFAD